MQLLYKASFTLKCSQQPQQSRTRSWTEGSTVVRGQCSHGTKPYLPVSLKNWKPLFWDTVQHLLHPTHTVLHHHIREGRVKEASRLNTSWANAVWGLQAVPAQGAAPLPATHTRSRAESSHPPPTAQQELRKEPTRKFFCFTTCCNPAIRPETGYKLHRN